MRVQAPRKAYEAAARVYCLEQYNYDQGSYVSSDARDQHIANDVRDTAEEAWLQAIVDAVWSMSSEPRTP